MTKIKAIIIDFGGVILRTEDRGPRTHLANGYGLTYQELDDIVFSSASSKQAALGKISSDLHWNQVCSELHINPLMKDKLIADFFAGDQLDWKLIKYLQKNNKLFQIALLSNAWDDLRHHLEFEWKFAHIFEIMVISAEVGLAKPDPKIFEYTLDRLGVVAGEAIFIDDFLENIQVACELGLNVIHFQNFSQLKNEITRMLYGVV